MPPHRQRCYPRAQRQYRQAARTRPSERRRRGKAAAVGFDVTSRAAGRQPACALETAAVWGLVAGLGFAVGADDVQAGPAETAERSSAAGGVNWAAFVVLGPFALAAETRGGSEGPPLPRSGEALTHA